MSTRPPEVPLVWLDTLWVQVAGTICNIACRHCFVSAGPRVDRHRMLGVDEVEAILDDGVRLGAREIWFTGGEPFAHPDIVALIDLALARAPLGVLTNGMLVDDAIAAALGERFRAGPYSLEIRVSLDGPDAASNDAIRGPGSFSAAVDGIRRLVVNGIEPVLAVTRLGEAGQGAEADAYVALLRDLGARPRLKWIPSFRIGREARRRGAYGAERLDAAQVADPEAPHRLMCGTTRAVTSRGVFPCPILVDSADARLGASLDDAMGPAPVGHPACTTCWEDGFSCSR